MEDLIIYQSELLKSINRDFVRFLDNLIPWDEKMIAIKGPRGCGKTTLLLQRLKYGIKNRQKALYATVEHPWFLTHSLYETAREAYMLGIRHLFFDEVHKYEKWSSELKIIYDGFPDLQIIFSASSALDIYKGEADLSRRVLTFELPGLSFREYLAFFHSLQFKETSLDNLVSGHVDLASQIIKDHPVIPLFRTYLKYGYYPLIKKTRESLYPVYLYNIINTVLEQDIQLSDRLSAAAVFKLRKLLGILAQSVPFEPNITSIAQKSGTSRNSVLEFLNLLEKARIINFLLKDQHGISELQKPDKIFLENTNLMYAIDPSPDIGTIRETFLMNQLKNSGLKVLYPDKGDFSVEDRYIIEVGGKNKQSGIPDIILAKDDMESGYGSTIPLWLFGFLY